VLKVICICFGLALLHSVSGLKSSATFATNKKRKTNKNIAFAGCGFAWAPDRFTVLFASIMLWFGFTTLNLTL